MCWASYLQALASVSSAHGLGLFSLCVVRLCSPWVESVQLARRASSAHGLGLSNSCGSQTDLANFRLEAMEIQQPSSSFVYLDLHDGFQLDLLDVCAF